jgi:hypothetical protein
MYMYVYSLLVKLKSSFRKFYKQNKENMFYWCSSYHSRTFNDQHFIFDQYHPFLFCIFYVSFQFLRIICVTNDYGYVPLVVSISRSFPRSWLITGFVTRLIRRVSLVEQELLTWYLQTCLNHNLQCLYYNKHRCGHLLTHCKMT